MALSVTDLSPAESLDRYMRGLKKHVLVIGFSDETSGHAMEVDTLIQEKMPKLNPELKDQLRQDRCYFCRKLGNSYSQFLCCPTTGGSVSRTPEFTEDTDPAGIQIELTTSTLNPRSSLLIIDAEVNGVPVSAFIDSHAQRCLISYEAAAEVHPSGRKKMEAPVGIRDATGTMKDCFESFPEALFLIGISWIDTWTSMASQGESLDWLEEKNLDI